MNLLLALLANLLFAIATFGADTSPLPANLRTLDGKEFKGVTFRGTTPDAIQILHEDGTASIAFANLPEELRAKFNYDPAKAADFTNQRMQQAQATRQRDELNAAVSDLQKSVKSSQLHVNLRIIQVLENGVIAKAKITGAGFDEVPGTIFVACATDSFVDGGILEGTIYQCGKYVYTNTTGARATIYRYARSVEAATELLMKDPKGTAAK